ncbi:peptidyl-prolyl cis-trans isomerase [Mesorhizobium sp. ZMM04-5]|uniref:Parvulin-like PPIase n=1 Tax=Mesorhizobium marinum TaxID=3228790 RepID=A0ABV3R4L1_9HYPH
MLKKIVREPLVHFLLLALAIFAVYGLFEGASAKKPDSIEVSVPKIEQMVSIFVKTWQRPPTPGELKGLIDDYVKEEIYVRQALDLGLDKDDTVIRRRLRQKMEFLADAETPVPTEADLQAYLDGAPDAFRIDGTVAFQQVFLNGQQRGEAVAQDAAAMLATLTGNPGADLSALGDATMLPPEMPLSTQASVAQTFGPEFAAAVARAPAGTWTGPIASAFGLHLVRVTDRVEGRVPALDEVREAVAREWTNDRRRELEDERFAELLKSYTVTIARLPGDTASQ